MDKINISKKEKGENSESKENRSETTPDIRSNIEISAKKTHSLINEISKERANLDEVKKRLHPALQEALIHPLASKNQSIYSRPPQKDFAREEQLFIAIDEVNKYVSDLFDAVDNPQNTLWPRIGEDIVQSLTINADVLSKGGILGEILIALKVIAKTKLREELHKSTNIPFSEEQFEREQYLFKAMKMLLKGVSTK